jgi:hypothetical protein
MALLTVFVLLYLTLALAARLLSDRLIFQPPPASYRDTSDIIKIRTPSGTRISAIYLPDPRARYTILFSHGNGEDIGYASEELERLRRLGFSVFAYDYQGYGTSEGAPSESNAYEDISAAYTYLTTELDTPPNRIIAHGRSLGGALAIDLAAREPLAGLIVESSLVSAYRVMTRRAIFPGDKFRSANKLPRVGCPVFIMHGTNDEVIPLWHGEKLFAIANEPKRSLWVEGAGHNNLIGVAGARFGHAMQEFRALIDREQLKSQS